MGVADTVLGLDQFGFVPTLKIQKKEKVPSIFGLLCTILVVVFLLIIFCTGLAALARHNKPTIVATEINGADKKTSIYLNHHSYFFIFGVYDPDDGDGRYYIDPDYFTLDINMIVDEEVKEAYTTANAGVIPLTVKKCQEVMPDYTGFEDNYCFRYDATDNSVFVQKYERAHIEIKLNLCDTSVPGHTCVANPTRDDKIQRSMLYTLIPYYSVDANDYKDPIKMDYAETRTPLTITTKKEVVVSIQKFTFISDNGWLFESEKKQSGVTMESTVVDFTEDVATGTFLTIIVQGTGDKMEYKRRYPKLQDILSQVVGLASPIFLILGFIIYPYVEVKMQEKLVGAYYDVKTTRGGKPAKGASAFGMANDMKVESMDNGYNPLVKGSQIAPGSPTTPGSVGTSNTNLRVGFCEWLGSFFKTNIRVKMLQDSQDILTRNVDLFHLNKKIAEIDRIKAVLMTEEQRILFENLPRPVVVMDLEAKPKSKDAIQYENWAEIDEEKTAKVKDAYDAVKSSSSKNACDKKLLSFYEDKY